MIACVQANTALHLAAVNGHAAVVKLLLDHSASKDVKNKEGKLPVDMAKDDATRAVFA